jgi:hypothetical protein
MPQQQQQNGGPSFRGSFNLFRTFAEAHATCVTPFIEDQAGSESKTLAGPIALIGMFVYGGLVNDGRVLIYIGIWVIAMLSQRCDSMLCRRRGMVIHSRHGGRPVVALMLAPLIKSWRAAKLLIEPSICLASALMLDEWSPAVAKLVGYAGVSIVVVELIDRQLRHQRQQAVMDSRLDMEDLANGVRQRFGDFR